MSLGNEKLAIGPPEPVHHYYRAFVGSFDGSDVVSAVQFNLLTSLGLREHHYLLDIGCGSLRLGRLLIVYLLPGRYFGIEPEKWLIEEAIKHECGEDLIRIKRPIFSNDTDFTCTQFGRKFDFILAYSIFTHASQTQIRRCLSEVKKCMKPESIFVATFVKGDKDYTGEEWIYPRFVTYTSELMTQMVSEFGLRCHLTDWHYREQDLLLITYPETEVSIPDSNKLETLKLELVWYKEMLRRLENHPYVRFGRKAANKLQRIRRLLHLY